MRKVLTMAAALACLAVPVASHAQVSLGLRLGYGLPMGEAEKGSDLKDGVKGQVPVQLDAMYRFTPNVSAGAYLAYGFAQMGSELNDVCDLPGVDCSAHSYRVGVQGAYDFKPGANIDPWVGVGAGYEWTTLSFEAGGQKGSMTLSGIEFASLQAGADYRVAPNFSVGPFLSLGFGRYSDISTDGQMEQSASIDEKATHEWLQMGFRGTFDL